jgi:hypothetical protein
MCARLHRLAAACPHLQQFQRESAFFSPHFLLKALLLSDGIIVNHAITGFCIHRLRGGQRLYVLAVVAP